MKALILAGGEIDEEDLLSDFHEFRVKALIPICGKPMVQWVVDAMDASEFVDSIFMVGLDNESGLVSSKPITYLPDQFSLFENIKKGANYLSQISNKDELFVLVSGDIPGLTVEMVDWLCSHNFSDDLDIVYSVVSKSKMEETFPKSNRSYIKFKDTQICGGDINLINTKLMAKSCDLWEKLSESRKSSLKQAALIGFDTLLLLVLKLLTLDQTAERVCKKLNISGKALQVPYAEMGMDVDKPHQLELMREFLSKRVD